MLPPYKQRALESIDEIPSSKILEGVRVKLKSIIERSTGNYPLWDAYSQRIIFGTVRYSLETLHTWHEWTDPGTFHPIPVWHLLDAWDAMV